MREYKNFSQNDPLWKDILLGDGQKEIGEVGCLDSAFADLASYYGKDISPLYINQLCKNYNLFIQSNLLANNTLQRLFPDIQYIGADNYVDIAADLSKLKILLSDPGTSVILRLKLNNGPHFVIALDTDGVSAVTIADTWDGKVKQASQYGDPKVIITEFIVYRGIVPAISTISPPIQPELKLVDLQNTKYKEGDLLKPLLDIPTGPSPGKEDFNYGRISVTAPARVLGVIPYNGKAYYNIDQRDIGGGTGFAEVDQVDATQMWFDTKVEEVEITPPIIEESKSTPEVIPVAPKTYSEEEYNQLLVKLNETTNKLNELQTTDAQFSALGFNKISDVNTAIEKEKQIAINLNVQLSQVLKDNAELHKMLEAKESQDATAIDQGIQALEDLIQLKKDFIAIATAADSPPTLSSIIETIKGFRQHINKAIVSAKENIDNGVEVANELADGTEIKTFTVRNKTNVFDWLVNLFKLGK